MFKLREKSPIVFLDFDNTITKRDVLGAVIEKFSINDDWIKYENEWRVGKIGSAECLEAQLLQVRAGKAELFEYVKTIPIDPDFPHLLKWLKEKDIPVQILSDGFFELIQCVLEYNKIENIPIYANKIRFEEANLIPSFPYRSHDCKRCAHCKKIQLMAHPDNTRVYIGDGLSDVCPAMEAEIVFAKDDLREYMAGKGKSFFNYTGLNDVLNSFRLNFDVKADL